MKVNLCVVFILHICKCFSKDLNVAVLLGSDMNNYFTLERVRPVIDVGLEVANRDILQTDTPYRILPIYKNCGFKNSSSLGIAADLKRNSSIIGIMGPNCTRDNEAIIGLADYFNLAVLTSGATDATYDDKTVYTTLTRFTYKLSRVGDVMFSICQYFNWTSVIRVVDNSNIFAISFSRSLMTSQLQTILDFTVHISESLNNASKVLDSIKTKARIIILCIKEERLRGFMLAAARKGMTDGNYVYLFFQPARIESNLWDTSNNTEENIRAKAAFDSVLKVVLQPMNDSQEYHTFVNKVKTTGEKLGYNGYNENPVDAYLVGFYHATLALAYAVRNLVKDGKNPYNASIINYIWNKTFQGLVEEFHIDEQGDKYSKFTLLDMNSRNGLFEEVARIYEPGLEYIPINSTKIYWPGYNVPSSTLPCQSLKEGCRISNEKIKSVIIAIIVSSILFCIIGIFGYRYFKKTALPNNWEIHWHEIHFFETSNKDHSRISMKSHQSQLSHSSFSSRRTTFYSLGSKGLRNKNVATYKDNIVLVKRMKFSHLKISNEFLFEIKGMLLTKHDNLTIFIGFCATSPNIALVTEFCAKGTLQEFLLNDSMDLDWMFRLSFMNDLIKGMLSLHSSIIEFHGDLRSSNCVVTNRFVLKVAGFGLRSLRKHKRIESASYHKKLLWRAPELLKNLSSPGTRKGDVYSFGIILHEIVMRCGTFEDGVLDYDARTIVQRVKITEEPLFRPKLTEDACDERIRILMEICWSELPEERPTFRDIKSIFHKLNKKKAKNLMDSLLDKMETYAKNLEQAVEDKTQQLYEEKQRSEKLLFEMLPKSVAFQLINGHQVEPEAYERVTIYMSDIVGFDEIAAQSTPLQVVDLLNDLYVLFDNIIDSYDVYKVETINDAYMVVSGLPDRNGTEHVRQIALMALMNLKTIKTFEIRHLPEEQLRLRIGMHSGSCVSGVVGLKMPRYCLFGDTVNTTSRMESHGLPLKIHLSESCKNDLDIYEFVTEERGIQNIKGKGEMRTYWLIKDKKDTDCIEIEDTTKM